MTGIELFLFALGLIAGLILFVLVHDLLLWWGHGGFRQ